MQRPISRSEQLPCRVMRQGDLTNQFIFRTILAPIQNIFKFPNQVRKTYGPEDGIDLS